MTWIPAQETTRESFCFRSPLLRSWVITHSMMTIRLSMQMKKSSSKFDKEKNMTMIIRRTRRESTSNFRYKHVKKNGSYFYETVCAEQLKGRRREIREGDHSISHSHVECSGHVTKCQMLYKSALSVLLLLLWFRVLFLQGVCLCHRIQSVGKECRHTLLTREQGTREDQEHEDIEWHVRKFTEGRDDERICVCALVRQELKSEYNVFHSKEEEAAANLFPKSHLWFLVSFWFTKHVWDWNCKRSFVVLCGHPSFLCSDDLFRTWLKE